MYTDEFGLVSENEQQKQTILQLTKQIDQLRQDIQQMRTRLVAAEINAEEATELLSKSNQILGNLARIYDWIVEACRKIPVSSAELDEALRECALLLASHHLAETDK